MHKLSNLTLWPIVRKLGARLGMLLLLGACLNAHAAGDVTANANAATLQEKYQSLQAQLTHNQFGRPLYLNSSETSSSIKGDIYAIVDYPFDTVHAALINPSNWCDVMILHLNTKYCRASGLDNPASATLSMRVGKKYEQPLADTYRLDFSYRITTNDNNYFDIRLNADQGPLDTHDYRIRLEAIPAGDGRSFLHLVYSYSYGFASRMAARAYLATAGSDKVGFTQEDKSADGKPRYIGGTRGTVERNTMRYYLAIDAYLSGLATAAPEQLEQRLQAWFTATERYPRQLHEVDRATYLSMKHKEYARQRAEQAPD